MFFDLGAVEILTEEVVLYILCALDRARKRGRQSAVRGNHPQAPECHAMLQKCGFYKFVYSGGFNFQRAGNVYEIKSGVKVDPAIAKAIKDFAKERLPGIEEAVAKIVYTTLIECMANTNNHAYSESDVGKRWWVMASLDERSSVVTVTFLDNGAGIPATVRTKKRELLAGLLKRLGAPTLPDGDLIVSTLDGEFRTRTAQTYRGKGLPRIYELVGARTMRHLRVVSLRGYVECQPIATARILESSFVGTLLQWQVGTTSGTAEYSYDG